MAILRVFRTGARRQESSFLLLLAAILTALSAMSASACASEPVDDLLAGLQAAAAGQFEQADAPLTKAATAAPGHVA
jgi:hypothetical protein